MKRERQRVFKESLSPKLPNKKVNESCELKERKEGTTVLVLNVTRDVYGLEDLGGTLTVEELIDELQQHDMSLPVVFGNDKEYRGWYTYGALDFTTPREFTYYEEEDEEEIDESKEKGHAKFKQEKNPFKK